MRLIHKSIIALIIFILAIPALAQNPPPEFDIALAALSEEVGTDLTTDDLDNFSWEEFQFGDASLGCPQDGMMYAQAITPGYQILLVYQGTAYDYRIATGGDMAILCATSDAPTTVVNPPELTIPVPPAILLPSTSNIINAQTAFDVEAVAENTFIEAATWSPDGSILAVASAEQAVWLYDTADLTQTPQDIMLGAIPSALAFSADSSLLVIGDIAGGLTFWDVANNNVIMQFQAHDTAVADLSFSPDGSYMVSISEDNFARFFGITGE